MKKAQGITEYYRVTIDTGAAKLEHYFEMKCFDGGKCICRRYIIKDKTEDTIWNAKLIKDYCKLECFYDDFKNHKVKKISNNVFRKAVYGPQK